MKTAEVAETMQDPEDVDMEEAEECQEEECLETDALVEVEGAEEQAAAEETPATTVPGDAQPVSSPSSPSNVGSLQTLLLGQEQMALQISQTLVKEFTESESQIMASLGPSASEVGCTNFVEKISRAVADAMRSAVGSSVSPTEVEPQKGEPEKGEVQKSEVEKNEVPKSGAVEKGDGKASEDLLDLLSDPPKDAEVGASGDVAEATGLKQRPLPETFKNQSNAVELANLAPPPGSAVVPPPQAVPQSKEHASVVPPSVLAPPSVGPTAATVASGMLTKEDVKKLSEGYLTWIRFLQVM